MVDPGSNDDDADDRRREERAPIELKVEYKRLNTFFYDYTKNISKGGTFIKTDRPLDIGTVFRFLLRVPVAAEPIELRGEVRWVIWPGQPPPAAAGGESEAGMGIRYVYESPEERASIERVVEKLMVGSLGQLIYSRLVSSEGEPGEGGEVGEVGEVGKIGEAGAANDQGTKKT
jgi:type IV pilus assembly protein PilZ